MFFAQIFMKMLTNLQTEIIILIDDDEESTRRPDSPVR